MPKKPQNKIVINNKSTKDMKWNLWWLNKMTPTGP